jgi:competence protein ComFC
MKLLRWLGKAADAAMPYINKCEVCGIERDVDDCLCSICRDEINTQVHGETKAKELTAFSVYNYSGSVAKLVRGYKYNGRRYLADFMAGEMSKALNEDFDSVCYVPLHKKRLRQRGFDQAELLAKSISKTMNIPFKNVIERIRNTKTQVSLGLKQRQENMKGAFAASGQISGNVVLVDDVLTTGATAGECAAVLLDAGASNVFVLTFARSIGDAPRKRKWFTRR